MKRVFDRTRYQILDSKIVSTNGSNLIDCDSSVRYSVVILIYLVNLFLDESPPDVGCEQPNWVTKLVFVFRCYCFIILCLVN